MSKEILYISSERGRVMLTDNQSFEVLDASELAKRWRVPVSWVREHTRDRAADPIPTVGWAAMSVSSGAALRSAQMVGQSAEIDSVSYFSLD